MILGISGNREMFPRIYVKKESETYIRNRVYTCDIRTYIRVIYAYIRAFFWRFTYTATLTLTPYKVKTQKP